MRATITGVKTENPVCALADEEWAKWHALTPGQRWRDTEKLWTFYLDAGGSLDREPDTQEFF